MLGDDFDAEETTGTWGGKKKNFYGGNPNESPAHKKPGKEKEKDNDENELVILVASLEPVSTHYKGLLFA